MTSKTIARRIYIAGPMRGLPEHNFPAFNRAAARFRALGWAVMNPVEIGAALGGNDSSLPPEAYVRADIVALASCDAIALLPGWEKSVGARCEAIIAITLGLPFYDAGTCLAMRKPVRVVCSGGYESAPGECDTLDGLTEEIRAWQAVTFPHATPSSVAEHLYREANELKARPSDTAEMADIFFLLVGASRDHDLVGAVRAKLEENRARQWGEPDEHGVVEHIL